MKRGLATIVLIGTVAATPLMAFAAPETMPDGGVFDADYYAQNNPDVVAALGSDGGVLYQHYSLFGKSEGRLPYAAGAATTTTAGDFDAVYYAQNNPDVVAVLGTDPAILYQHWIQFGQKEGRKGSAGEENAATTTTAPEVQKVVSFADWGSNSNQVLNQYLQSLGYTYTTNCIGAMGVGACWTPEPENPQCDCDYSILITLNENDEPAIHFVCGMGFTHAAWVSEIGYDTEKLCLMAQKHAQTYHILNTNYRGELGLIGNFDYGSDAYQSYRAVLDDFWDYCGSLF
ncbi:MAG: hypothetical protein K6B69_12555 [Lachnospiraceae bacterium]|nr:hypothetical protein [Lachnospiraceae bacterium]